MLSGPPGFLCEPSLRNNVQKIEIESTSSFQDVVSLVSGGQTKSEVLLISLVLFSFTHHGVSYSNTSQEMAFHIPFFFPTFSSPLPTPRQGGY